MWIVVFTLTFSYMHKFFSSLDNTGAQIFKNSGYYRFLLAPFTSELCRSLAFAIIITSGNFTFPQIQQFIKTVLQ